MLLWRCEWYSYCILIREWVLICEMVANLLEDCIQVLEHIFVFEPEDFYT